MIKNDLARTVNLEQDLKLFILIIFQKGFLVIFKAIYISIYFILKMRQNLTLISYKL
jgi:hypothetical protein